MCLWSQRDPADAEAGRLCSARNYHDRRTGDGYVIDPKYVASGGMLCLSRNGAARQSAGPVYLIPLSSFENFLGGNAWQIFEYNQ